MTIGTRLYSWLSGLCRCLWRTLERRYLRSFYPSAMLLFMRGYAEKEGGTVSEEVRTILIRVRHFIFNEFVSCFSIKMAIKQRQQRIRSIKKTLKVLSSEMDPVEIRLIR